MKATILILNLREPTESLERKFQQISLSAKKEDPSPSVEKKPLEGKSSIPSQDQENRQARDLYCEVCQKSFTGEQSQLEHMKSEKHMRKVLPALECQPCQKVFSGPESLEEHLKSKKHLNMVQ